jgi:hypothetical protein
MNAEGSKYQKQEAAMATRIALIHTVTSLVPVFNELFAELIPDDDLYHVVDESLIQNTILEGVLSPITSRRAVDYIVSAERAGAEFVLVKCSSIGPALDFGKLVTNIPFRCYRTCSSINGSGCW